MTSSRQSAVAPHAHLWGAHAVSGRCGIFAGRPEGRRPAWSPLGAAGGRGAGCLVMTRQPASRHREAMKCGPTRPRRASAVLAARMVTEERRRPEPAADPGPSDGVALRLPRWC